MSQIKTFEAMLESGQDSDMLRFTLGNAYFAEEKHVQAITHLREAVTINPGYSSAWKVLGRSLAAIGSLDEALDAFDQGLQIASQNGDKQVEKEITVFRKRVVKQIEAQ